MSKEKIKRFIENHKVGIAIVTTGVITTAVCIIGGTIGVEVERRKAMDKVMSEDWVRGIWNTLKDASNTYPKSAAIYTAICGVDNPCTMSELGVLGKEMAKDYADRNLGFTHFIAIGKELKD